MTLQNGLGNAETLAAKAERVMAGTTTHGVTFTAPGEIVHAGAGETIVGPFAGASDAQGFADALNAAGIATQAVMDVRRELWAKAVVNAAINPLTTVLRRPNGELVRHDDLRTLMGQVAAEAVAAAGAGGVSLDPEALAARAVEVATRTADNRSSMLQDVERGHRTEIEAITGALRRAAAATSVPLYYNETLEALVRGLERSFGGPV